MKGSFFGSVEGSYAMDGVHCTGDENDIHECLHFSDHSCEVNKAAGVKCFKNLKSDV